MGMAVLLCFLTVNEVHKATLAKKVGTNMCKAANARSMANDF